MKKFYSAIGMLAVFATVSAANVAGGLSELHQLGQKMPAERVAIQKAMRAPAKVSSVDEVLGNYLWLGYSALQDKNGNPYGYGQSDLQLAKVGDKVLAYGLNTMSDVEIEASIDVAAGTVSLPAKVLLYEETQQGVKLQGYLMHMKWGSQQPEESKDPLVLKISDGGLEYTDQEDLYGICVYQGGELAGFYYLYYYNQFSKRPDKLSNEGWEDYGTAKVSQNWFSGNPDINLMDTEYDVKVQRSTDDENILRVVNPYGAGTPFEKYNTSAAEGSIVFDITNPQCVVVDGVYEQLLGYTEAGNEVFCKMGTWAGFMMPDGASYPLNSANVYVLEGFTTEDIVDEFDENELSFYDADTKTIVIRDAVFTLSSIVSQGEYYNGWTEAGQMGTPTFVITEGAGVDDIEFDSNEPIRYYNFQGMEVANPENGQLVIKKLGSKVQKVIF